MIAFVCGVLVTLLLPHLPPLWFVFLAGILPIAGIALSLWRRNGRFVLLRQLLYPLLYLLAGVAFGALQGHWRLASVIPSQAEQQDIALTGFITGLPLCRRQWNQQQCQFDVDIISAQLHAGEVLPITQVQLTQYGAGAVEAGACIAATVRLKRPHGLFNAGSIDFETSKLRSGVDATGYVRAVRNERCVEGIAALRWWPVRAIAVARTAIRDAVITHFDDNISAGLVLALGDYSLVDHNQWALFNATGTQHLVTVSGLHIGIAASLGLGLGNLLCLPLRSRGARRQQFAAFCAWLVALIYSLLAGGSTPALRSLLMLSLFLLMRLLRRESSLGFTLWTAFAAIVIADPLQATSIGFWLSFGAVSVLVVGLQWRRQRFRFISSLAAPQWVVFVGLAPVLLACFGQLPLVSMLANLVAVPWSSVAVMPLLLLSMLCGFAVPALNALVTATLEYLCLWLMWCRDLPVNALQLPTASPFVSLLASALAAVFFLLPRGLWLRPQALVLVGALLLAGGDAAPLPELTLDVFDVGQGLSVLVSEGAHHLLFDTGAAFGDDFDAAQMAVLPFLRSRGIGALDILMVSHADMDHAGGVRSVLDAVQVGSIFSGEPIAAAPAAQRCRGGQRWQLGEARLKVLFPATTAAKTAAATVTPQRNKRLGNNASCVLLIEFRGRRLLLTGDIEAAGEQALLAAAAPELAAGVDVLVAPHHGSHSSSTPAFVRRLHPAHVVFAAGYRNRYGHPHADVVERYHEAGSIIYRSDRDGMIRFRVGADGKLQAVRWREHWRHYWFADS